MWWAVGGWVRRRESNRVPVTAPAGAKELATEEEDHEHHRAGPKEGEEGEGGRIGQAEGLRREAAEELVDIVLHVILNAVLVPPGKIVSTDRKPAFGARG